MRRALAMLAAGAALAALPAASAAERAEEPKTNLADVSDEVMCVVCGVPLDHALENPQAQQEREFIRRLIAQGKTKDEIKDALVAQYGENVLALPESDGFGLAAWLVPALAFAVAVLGIGLALRRWRRDASVTPDDGSAEPEPPKPPRTGEAAAAAKRLDEDLSRYRL